MSFTTFNTFSGINLNTSKIISALRKVENGNFINPTVASGGHNNQYVNITNSIKVTDNSTLMPGWFLTSSTSNINTYIMTPDFPVFLPNSSSGLPLGYTGDYYQWFTVQLYDTNSFTFYQTLSLSAGTSTLTFYAAGSKYKYTTNNTFSVTLGGTTLASGISVTLNNWTAFTYTYNAATDGNFILKFIVSNIGS
jgi:hypothetical protein